MSLIKIAVHDDTEKKGKQTNKGKKIHRIN